MELPAEEIERIQRSVVEDHKLKYSDEQLWENLNGYATKYLANEDAMTLMHMLVRRDDRDSPMWQRFFDRLALENSSSKPVMDCIAWHLTQRGDQRIAAWVGEFEEKAFKVVFDYFYRPPEVEARDKL